MPSIDLATIVTDMGTVVTAFAGFIMTAIAFRVSVRIIPRVIGWFRG